jgi:hypothetical protein
MRLDWTRRLPWGLLRQGCLGFLVELTAVLMLLFGCGLIGYIYEILPNLADPFAYYEPPLPERCLASGDGQTVSDEYDVDCVLDYHLRDASYPYIAAAAIGIGLWTLVYVILLLTKACYGYDARHDEAAKDKRAARAHVLPRRALADPARHGRVGQSADHHAWLLARFDGDCRGALGLCPVGAAVLLQLHFEARDCRFGRPLGAKARACQGRRKSQGRCAE